IPDEFDDVEDDAEVERDIADASRSVPADDIAAEFEDLPPLFPQLSDVPERFLRIPGKLQHAVDFFNATAVKPQPQFAVQTAIAIGSVVLSRQYSTDENNMTSLYLLNLVE